MEGPAKRQSSDTDLDALLDEALAARLREEWEQADVLFRRYLSDATTVPGDALAAAAICRFKTGDVQEAIRLAERAVATYLSEGNPRAAGLCCAHLVALHEITGEEVAIRAWEQRGLSLLDPVGPCVEQGYLALCRTGCEVVDAADLERRAELALELALRFQDRDLEVRARADKGLALVSQGFVNDGFVLLDEVMVSIAAGGVSDTDIRGRCMCSLLSACERVGDIARVEYWCSRIEREPIMQHPVLLSHCRLVYGVAEALRGNWDEAESHLSHSLAAETANFGQRAASAARLADVRMQQGRLSDAAALLQGFEDRVEAVPSLARLRLIQGRPDEAAALLRSAVRSLGDDTMRVVPLLSMLVEAELARGQQLGAQQTLAQLERLEQRCESNEVRAHRRLSAGQVARSRDDMPAAIDELETALTLLTHYERPLLTAQIRLELAKAMLAADDMASATIEAQASLTTFRRLGVVPSATDAESLLDQLRRDDRLAAADGAFETSDKSAVLTSREREVASLAAQGLTNRDIADRLVLSVRTVEGHIDRALGKLDLHTRTQLALWMAASESSTQS